MNPFWLAQLKKDFLWFFSYKITFFGQVIGVLVTTYTFFYLAKSFENAESTHLSEYNNNYFLFAILGISLVDLISTCIRSSSRAIRDAQTFGYIDQIINSKINMPYIIASTMTYPCIIGLIKLAVYLCVAFAFKPYELSLANALLLFLTCFMTLISLVGVALCSCAFVIAYKQGDPVNYILTISITLFSGVLFPTTVLPEIMQNISQLIPVTHGLEMMRKIVIYNSNTYISLESITTLSCFMIANLLVGVFLLKHAVKKVKFFGTSGEY